MLLETHIWLCKFQDLLNFICKRILLSLTNATEIFNVKHVSLCAQAMIFHVTLQILQISFFIQCRISKAKRNPNASKLYTALFSSAQWHENKRWQLPFLGQRAGWFCLLAKVWGSPTALSPGWWIILPEPTADTKQGGWCHRTDGWFPAERPWLLWFLSQGSGCPQDLLGVGHSLFCNERDQKISSQL